MEDIKVFKMNEYEWYATRWDGDVTNDWYNKNFADNDIDEIELVDLDTEGMWWETVNKQDIDRISDSDEVGLVVLGKATFGDLIRREDNVYRFISFREAISFDKDFTEPYCIASTEY